MSIEVVLGPGRVAVPARFPDTVRGGLAGELAGFRVTHPRGGVEGAEECSGGSGSWIPVRIREWMQGGWTMESPDPLTLSPSLLCRVCGDHGWIRDGKWVPA